MTRDIFDYQGIKIGELTLPENTEESVWIEKLSAFAVAPPTSQQILDSRMNYSIEERIEWTKSMMKRLKKRNISMGINGLQSLWLHHRMRALEINFLGVSMVEDIINMAASGDIETACLALLYSTPDDGSQPYHWYNQATKDWLVSEMKGFLAWP